MCYKYNNSNSLFLVCGNKFLFAGVQYHRNDNFLKELGLRIKDLRKAKQLTQADMAFEMDVPISQIGRIERGEANFSVSYLPDIARVLNVSPSELLQL